MRRSVLVVTLLLAFPLHAALTRSDLQTWLDQALEAAKQVPVEERRAVAYSYKFSGAPSKEETQAALLKIALRPSGNGWWDLMWAVPRNQKDLALEFLEAVYRGRAGLDSVEARQWQQGLAEILFTTGHFEEGLRLQRSIARGDVTAYGVILLAMMERVNGNGEPFARLVADPPVSSVALQGQTPADYMLSVVTAVSGRMMQILPASKLPPEIPAMMMKDKQDWDSRMDGILIMSERSAAAGMQELRKVLADPTAPDWAVNDAWFGIAQIPVFSVNQPHDVVRAIECWLLRRSIVIPRATAETWQKLRELEATPEQEEWMDSHTHECFHSAGDELSPDCLLSAAGLYMTAATNARLYDQSRRSIEWAAALSIEHGRGLNNVSLFLTLAAQLAPTDEAMDQTLRYAATLPVQKALQAGMGEEVAAAVRNQTDRTVDVPWSGPLAPLRPCP